jgi:putative nucleotidyltransferase with HDIG domain
MTDMIFDVEPYLNAVPDLAALKDVPQNPEYHGEGDVLTHTRMVVDTLLNHPLWQTLSAMDQKTLFLAALFHDIGKLPTTRLEQGRLTSPNHSLVGAQLARFLLWQGIPDPVPFSQREQVVHLIRNHMQPLYLLKKRNAQKLLLRISQSVRIDFLALLAECDIRGRISTDTAESLETIELFREYAREQGCFDRPYPFPSAYSRFFYFSHESARPEVDYYNDRRFQVILLSGLPAAGKDYWITAHGEGLPMISLDAIRAELGIAPEGNQGRVIQASRQQAKKLLAAGQPFIWNGVNRLKRIRKPIIDLCTAYGAGVKIIYLESDIQTHLERNSKRPAPVPEQVIHRMARRNEIPEVHEAQYVEYTITSRFSQEKLIRKP